jgi:alcohol dehydrogenase
MDTPSFQYTTSLPRLFCGSGSLAQLARELERLNSRRAVIVCGSSLAQSGSTLDRVRSAMAERCAGVFTGVRGHTPLPVALEAARELKRLNADAVVALGGGSAIVTARAAAILLAEGAEVRALCTTTDATGALRSPKLLAPKLPQLVITTTPNTATVKAGTAVVDPASGERLALFDPKTRAQSVFIDPELLRTAPPTLTISASLDTLTLALEGLMSKASNPISDALLMHSVRLLGEHLHHSNLREDMAARSELVIAAVLCGHGTDITGAGLATVLGHAVGAGFGAENGVVKAIVMPYAVQFNAEAAAAGVRKAATALGGSQLGAETALTTVVDALKWLFDHLGIARRLRDIGIPHDALKDIAERAMGDWFLRGNPRAVRSATELQRVLEQAW